MYHACTEGLFVCCRDLAGGLLILLEHVRCSVQIPSACVRTFCAVSRASLRFLSSSMAAVTSSCCGACCGHCQNELQAAATTIDVFIDPMHCTHRDQCIPVDTLVALPSLTLALSDRTLSPCLVTAACAASMAASSCSAVAMMMLGCLFNCQLAKFDLFSREEESQSNTRYRCSSCS